MTKVTVITGASSGIGAALAKQLGSKGHYLVLAARREDELNRVAKETGTKTLAVKADVTSRHGVERIRDVALQEFGHVDVWVSNAGRGITRPVMELTDHEIDEIVAVVLKSVLYGAQTIIPLPRTWTGPSHQRLILSGPSPSCKLSVNLERRKSGS